MYAWEDEGVVLAIISFWASVCDVLQGRWSNNQSNQSIQQHQQCTMPEDGRTTNSHLQDPACSHSSDQHQQQQQQDRQMGYISWMWHLGLPCLSAVVALLHQFHCLTGICQLQSKQRSTQLQLQLLQLFLQLGADTAAANSSSSSRGNPAQQLLQAARWLAEAQQGGFPASSSAAVNIAAVLKPGEAFAAVVKLLQAATVLQELATAAAAADEAQAAVSSSGSSKNSRKPYWQQLAAAAGRFLQAAYGWMHLDGRPAAAAAAAVGYGAGDDSAMAVVRQCETPYDCCMMELLHGMLQGPFNRLDSASNILHDSVQAARDGAAAAAAAAAEGASEVAGKGMQLNRVSQRQQQQQWEDWCSSDSFGALALLLAGYDKPQQLVRGVVSLVVHHQQQQQGPAKITTEAEKAAIRQVSEARQQVVMRLVVLMMRCYV
jgi:hypothetical protein